jgi:hypothetical protein
MFTADEVSSVVDLAKLKELKHRIVHLFLYANQCRQQSISNEKTQVKNIFGNNARLLQANDARIRGIPQRTAFEIER